MTLLRRRMMMQLAEEDGTKYKLPTVDYSDSTKEITISGNHIHVVGKTTSTTARYCDKSGNVSTSRPTTLWFQLNIGDAIEIVCKNIVYTNTSSSNRTYNFNWCQSDATGNVLTVGMSLTKNKTNQTMSDLTFTSASYTADRNISGITFGTNIGGCTIDFDLEFWVNGERYF